MPLPTPTSPQEKRFEALIEAVEKVSSQISDLSLERALIAIYENTAAVNAHAEALAVIKEHTRPFANLRFIFRKIRSYFR